MAEFNLRKFLIDVFNPQAGEQVLVMIDLPHDDIADNDEWKNRREMAAEWLNEFKTIGNERGFNVYPILEYQATGVGGAPLPKFGKINGEDVELGEIFKETTLVAALAEFSCTAALSEFALGLPRFRCASMPMISKSMEKTGLAADYKAIQKRCSILKNYMDKANSIEVEFSTGHKCNFDLRHRESIIDDGLIDQSVFGKGGDAVLNLPGGETFEVPYEGEIEGDKSKTEGELPLVIGGDSVVFVVEENKIANVKGDGPIANKWREFIAVDAGRRNIAEVAFGCNEMADPEGPIVEAEKSGFHWALGESAHFLCGTFGAEDFDNSENACHMDFTYAGKNEVIVKEAVLIGKDGSRVVAIINGEYVI